MGIINRIAARTASKKARRISYEERRRRVLSKRKSDRTTVKACAKGSA